MSRRLPIYLLIDTSGSMTGEAIEAVRSGLQLLVSALRQDPYALETAYLSIITFDSEARQTVPLTDLPSFQLPTIQATGLTAMGSALKLLADCIDREVIKKSNENARGDWKPVVFMLTDGAPTDNLNEGLEALKKIKVGNLVLCGAGSGADNNTLKQIANIQGEKGMVISLDTADQKTLSAFFKWVTQSISVTSKKIDLSKKDDGNELPPPPPEINMVH